MLCVCAVYVLYVCAVRMLCACRARAVRMLTLNCAPCQAAAKMEVPLSLYSETALDTIPIQPGSYSAALCFDMLDGAPEQAAAGAVSLLANALKPGGRMLFLEREKVGMPDLVREYGGCSVEFDTEGGFDVGGIPFNPDPDPTLSLIHI